MTSAGSPAADIAERVAVHSLRVLAPAGGFPSPARLFRAAARSGDLPHDELLARTLSVRFSASGIGLHASGKAALKELFVSLRTRTARRAIAMSGYNCPDVAAAAVAAGFSLVFLDCDERTLEPDPERLPRGAENDIAAVVFTNLYGMLDDIDRWKERLPHDEILFIDDACQSALGMAGGIHSGGRGGAGVLSFGRGKAFCGVGGGASMLFDGTTGGSIRENAAAGSFVSLAKAAIYACAEHPLLYGIPARIPAFGLGKTEYHADFSTGPISRGQAVVASAAMAGEEETAAALGRRTRRFAELLPAEIVQPHRERVLAAGAVLIRYPLLAPDKKIREEWYRALTSAGLGASRSYPCTLDRYPQLQGRYTAPDLARSHSVAERIITLPLHRFVRDADQERAAELIRTIG